MNAQSPILQAQASCPEHGPYTVETIVVGSLTLDAGCPACREAREKANLERHRKVEREERELRVLKALADSGIPQRYLFSTLDSYRPVTKDAASALEMAQMFVAGFPRALEQGTSLLFHGEPGTGKTHLGCAMVRAVIEAGFTARYANAQDILAAVKDTWGGAGSSREVLSGFLAPQLLVIDELGLQQRSDVDYPLLFSVINGRYDRMRPMVVISNRTVGELSRQFNDRVIDRLLENSSSVAFTWRSYRIDQGATR